MKSFVSVSALAVLLTLASAAHAQEATPPARKGFALGLGAGWGNAGADLTVVEEIDRQNGVVGDIAVGWGLGRDVVLGLEFEIWSQSFQEDNWAFNLTSVGITYFPMGSDAYVAAAVGIGTSEIKTGTTARQDGAGPGLSVAGGYEWWLSKELTLGPKIKWSYLDVGGDVTNNADYFALEVMMTWYKP